MTQQILGQFSKWYVKDKLLARASLIQRYNLNVNDDNYKVFLNTKQKKQSKGQQLTENRKEPTEPGADNLSNLKK